MNMQHPEALWLLAGLPPLILVFVGEYLHTRRTLTALGGTWLTDSAQSTVFFKWFLSTLFFAAFYFFAVMALAGFRWGEQPVEQDRKDTDIVFTVDVSRSMLASDAYPTRLQRAAELVQGLLQDIPSSRAALVVFKGKAQVLVPMTEDLIAIENALRYLGPELTSVPGTDVEEALRTSLAAFPAGSNRHQLVVLLSDGEGLEGNPNDLAIEAKRQGVVVITIGLGKSEGSGVALGDGSVLQDANGVPVITRLDATSLKRIADQSGGTYLEASEAGIFNRLVDEVQGFQSRREHEGFRLVPVSRDAIFIALALLCLSLYLLSRSIRWRKVW